MAKYKRVSRRIINLNSKMSTPSSNDVTTDLLPKLGSETVPTENPFQLPDEIGPTVHTYVEFPAKRERQAPKWLYLAKMGVGLGVTVPLVLLVFYHYEQLTVTCSSYL